uniref:Uncharacterized protein n=1 Tax=Cajanus cajan TaxID=3821 RepID=A0A151QR73_CAJCA|nr:hypothetical protein KK1_046406 [Cajanus cajan]
MGKKGGTQKLGSVSHTAISLRQEATGRIQTKAASNTKSKLRFEHLKSLALWATTNDPLIPSLAAFYGHQYATSGEATGVPPDPSLMTCQRCETVLQPDFNSTVRIEKNKSKVRHKHKKTDNITQNNVVYKCHFCLHQNQKITNMAEKVPSFKHCGASWFIDLATPDALYIFPVLTALSFLITVECNMQEGMEGNPVAGTVKNVSRGLAVLTVPFTMGFPKAIFCYWVTSNLFSRMYGLVLKVPGVKKTSGIPEIPVAAPTNPPQSPFSIKQATTATSGPSSMPDEPSKHSNKKLSSSAVISQRLRSLEKQVNGRKKNKK